MTTLKTAMQNFYNEHAYTHNYIMGVNYKGIVYAVTTTEDIVNNCTTLDKASRGAGYALKFKPNNDIRRYLIAQGAQAICSTEYFESVCANSKYNRGEIFERIITESVGQEWTKDSVPFTEAGDIEIDGIAYQIKYEKATFINEAQIDRMRGI